GLQCLARQGVLQGHMVKELEHDLETLAAPDQSHRCLQLAETCRHGRQVELAKRFARRAAELQPHDLRSRLLLLDLILENGSDTSLKVASRKRTVSDTFGPELKT